MKHKTYMANEYWEDYRRKQPKFSTKLQKICNYIKTILAEMIAKQVGHTDTNMIMQVYGHLMAEKEQSDKLKMQTYGSFRKFEYCPMCGRKLRHSHE